MIADAYISTDGLFRYWLTRCWDSTLPTVVWLMLNPSTADALKDDATIRKCMAYARAWGYGSIAVINLYALRSRDPQALLRASDPVGPHNDRWIVTWCEQARRRGAPVIAGWGNNASASRVTQVRRMMSECGLVLHAIEVGLRAPKHPLYLKKTLVPICLD